MKALYFLPSLRLRHVPLEYFLSDLGILSQRSMGTFEEEKTS